MEDPESTLKSSDPCSASALPPAGSSSASSSSVCSRTS